MPTRAKSCTADCEKVYTFILEFKAAYQGDSPSKRDIQKALGWTEDSSVTHALQQLELTNKIRCIASGHCLHIQVIGAKSVPP